MKRLNIIKKSNGDHWVGDGFPVRNILSYDDEIAQNMSPFLLMDFAGPRDFTPTTAKRGVGEHPHRGFETVTIVYDGEVEHRDSAGGGGHIGPGDVQWMTAASGLVHEEFHGKEFAKRGGKFQVVQLWVNLPKKDKMTKPGYQALIASQIPRVELAKNAGEVKVIAGEYGGRKGPARTFTPMNVWDTRLKKGAKIDFNVTDGWSTGIFVLRGRLKLHSGEEFGEAEMAVLDQAGTTFSIEALEDTTFLILNGQPLNETIVGHGPFVMNSMAEIRQAMVDYDSGRMGHLS